MSDFLNSIKITDEEKKKAISKILFTILHSPNVLSLNEFWQIIKQEKEILGNDTQERQEIEQKLNQNEILAAYSLAKEIKISTMSSSAHNKKLFEYLELKLGSVNEDNLLKFINETVKDIEITKKRTPNVEWRLQIGKIFSRLDGKNPYNEEDFIEQVPDDLDKSNKIIKFR